MMGARSLHPHVGMTDSPTDPLATLRDLCHAIAGGRYDDMDRLFAISGDNAAPQHIRDLAEAFGSMVVQIEAREFRLEGVIAELRETHRQLEEAHKKLASENVNLKAQVQRLKIEIDQGHKEREVSEITDTDYFRHLQERARHMRNRQR